MMIMSVVFAYCASRLYEAIGLRPIYISTVMERVTKRVTKRVMLPWWFV